MRGKTVWIVWEGFRIFDIVETKTEAELIVKLNKKKLTIQETLDDFRGSKDRDETLQA